jgi:hypothetical protein
VTKPRTRRTRIGAAVTGASLTTLPAVVAAGAPTRKRKIKSAMNAVHAAMVAVGTSGTTISLLMAAVGCGPTRTPRVARVAA